MPQFARDRFTWLAYFMLGYYAYLQATLGPLVPFLRAEFDLNYTVAGYHLSAFALGMVISGFITDGLAKRWGRYGVFWLGSAGMGVGALLLSLGGHVGITIGSSFIMGFIGTWMLIMIQATLADRHGPLRAIALTEANILASATSAFAPAIVGFSERLNVGWRGALIVGVLAWTVLLIIYRHQPMPANQPVKVSVSGSGKLPTIFWVYWCLVVCLVSVEWCIIFWGADFLEKVVGLPKVDAATALGAYFLANVVGRTASSQLARRFSIQTLLTGAIIVSALGFPIFWLAQPASVNVIGLFIAGIGVGSLFPLALSAASLAGIVNTNRASSRISMAAGVAILITPQILASVADQVGLQRAYTIVAILLGVILLMNFFASRVAQRQRTAVAGAALKAESSSI